MKKILQYSITIALMFMFYGESSFGQSTIMGIIRDGSMGDPMVGITVWARYDGSSVGDITGSDGSYSFTITVADGTSVTISASTATRTFNVYPGINWMNLWVNPPSLPSDFDGNYYNTVTIGNQVWMAENLLVTHFRNGTNIPNVTDPTAWGNLTSPGYCWYNNDFSTYKEDYGALYNWFTCNTRNLCPAGWHVPSDVEWQSMTNYLGGSDVAGVKLKEAGTTHWIPYIPSTAGTNESGFTALPGGWRFDGDGSFNDIGFVGKFWTSKSNAPGSAEFRYVHNSVTGIYISNTSRQPGFSVRCLQSSLPVVTTAPITVPTPTTAQSGGNVTSDGGDLVTARGVCWSTNISPTVFDNHTINGTDVGGFTSSLTGLTPNKTYNVRAYATNDLGTSYGNEVSFTTPCPVIGITTVQANVKCFGGSTGTVTAYPGGNGPWVYSWSTVPEQTTATASNLTAGTYTVNVIDANGCPGSKDITITQPAAVLTLSTTKVDVLCFGASTGSATVIPAGGTAPYTCSWNTVPVQITPGASNLSAGSYTVIVIDANGCTASVSVTISQPDLLSATVTPTMVTCNGANDGIISIMSPVGGHGTYEYSFDGGTTWQSTTSYSGLAPGNYNVQIRDADYQSCVVGLGGHTITQPAVLEAAGIVTTQSCNGCTDAAINLSTISGGTLPYTFAWTGPDGYSSASQNIAALKPGSYSVVVSDSHGCTSHVYFDVKNPFVVTNTGDENEIGTLRYAINYANTYNNATDLITFDIPFGLPTTIQPGSALPDIEAPMVIDGYTQPGASFEDLTLRVELEGTNAGAATNGLTINSNNCTVKGLIIDGFDGNGIQVASGTGNIISANSIFNNGERGIDLGNDDAVTKNDSTEIQGSNPLIYGYDKDAGQNNLQNFPELKSLGFSPGNVSVSGSIFSMPSTTYTLEFFASKVADNTRYGEGQTYLGSGSVTTNSAGKGTFSITVPTMTRYGDVITATATDPAGNTSEFSQAIGGLQDQILSSTKIPFHYQVNGQGVKSITSTAVVDEVISAFSNWSGTATSTMSFTNDKTDAPPQYASSSDNINLVSFTDNKFPFSPGILAVTAKTLKIGENDGVAQIMDADIVFNPYYVNNTTYDFGIADNPLYPGFFDIQSVTTHEIGHILGLLHSGVYSSTMWFEVGPGTTLRSLDQDDKSWLSYRYPDNTKYNQAFGSISGNIKYGYNNDPVAGAIVLTVDPATDLAVVHAFSDVYGNYLIPGLPPGSYRVYIMPLDGDVYGRDLRPGNISSYIYSNTVYTDYPGEFYNNPDGANESGITPTPVTVLAGQETTGIDFLTNIDLKPPTVVSVVPSSLATNISVLPNILITFSEPVNMNTVTDQTCYLTLTGNDTKIGGKYQPDGFEDRSDKVLFTLPENPLSYQSAYTLHITTGVTDLKTNPLEAEFTSSFSTGVQDVVYPTIKGTIPPKDAENVFLTEKIMVFFSEPMIKSSVESSFALTSDAAVKVVCSPSWDEYVTLTLTPKSPLIEGKTYTLIWTNAATDLAGNGLTAGSISFTTIPFSAPTVTYLEPGTNLTSNVAVESAIVVDFSEPIDAATVNASTFILTGTSQISGTFEFLNENSRVVFRPSANLTFGQTYSINLTNGIQDVSKSKQNFAGSTKTFTAATKLSKPHIDYIDPPASSIGLEVNIGGSGFDPDPSKNKVTFSGPTSSGVDALATSASLTSLTVKIPYGAVSGAIRVNSNGVLDDQDPNSFTTYIYIGSLVDPCSIATGNTGTGSKPRDGVVDYNGANAYITNSGDNTVSVITDLDTEDPVLYPPYELTRIQVGKTPMKIDLNPMGTRAYVTNFDSHTISVIDLTDENGKKNQVIETVNVGINPFGVVANGNMVYVANYGSKNVTVINTDPLSGGFDHAVANINTGTNNRDIDITVDGGLLVVTGDNGLTLIKMTKTALGFDYAVSNANSGTSTRDATITKDGGTVIVTTIGGDIFFVDIAPGDNFGTAYGNYNPGSNAGDGKITYDGLYYFVTNPDDNKVTAYKITYEGSGSGSGTISSSSGLTLKEYATIPVGDSPEGLAFDPANNRLIVVNSGSSDITKVTICCPAVKTASDYIKDLAFTVQQLMYQETLSRTSAGMLIGRLNDASLNILRNKTKTAVNNMDTFINKVNSLMNSGKLDKTTGNDLIKLAKQIIYMLEHPGASKSGTEETVITGADQSLPDLITESKIKTIYPNPFSESITIDYEIADTEFNSGKVMIQVYDISGRVISNLVNKNMEPGRYSVTWNGRYENGGSVSKGIYYIRFAAGKAQEVKRIMLVR